MSADVEAMARLWNKEGLSMGQIASHYGMTRQQVAGHIHRNRELFESRRDANGKKPRKPIVTASQKANERRKAFHAVKVAEEAAVAPVEPVEPEINGKEYDAGRLPMAKELLDLEPCHCRWPLTDIGPHLFCCAEVVIGSPYCAHHRARSKGKGTISEQRAVKDARWAA